MEEKIRKYVNGGYGYGRGGLYCLLSSFHPVIKHGIIARSIHCQLYAALKAAVKEGASSGPCRMIIPIYRHQTFKNEKMKK